MKKKILFSILAVVFILPCLFLASACSKQKHEDGPNQDAIFKVFQTAIEKTSEFDNSISLTQESFETDNLENEFYLPSYKYVTSYDEETNQAYSFGKNTWTGDIYTIFIIAKQGNLNRYHETIDTGYWVDGEFSLNRTKQEIERAISFDQYVLIDSYAENLRHIENLKNEFLQYVDENTTIERADFKISARENGDGTYTIEYVHSTKQISTYDNSVSLNYEEKVVTYKFTSEKLLSRDELTKTFFETKENGEVVYGNQQKTLNKTTIENSYDSEWFADFDLSEYVSPTEKIKQNLNIYVDGSKYVTYELSYGENIINYTTSVPNKTYCVGFDVFADENYTKELTNEKTKSYCENNVYMLSIPDETHVNIVQLYVNKTIEGKETIITTKSEIVEYDEYWPLYELTKNIKKQNEHYPYNFTTSYLDGKPIDFYLDIEPGKRYLVRNYNLETGKKSNIDVYIDGIYYETITKYDSTTLAHYVFEQYIKTKEISGVSLNDFRLKPLIYNEPNQYGNRFEVGDFHTVGENFNLNIEIGAQFNYSILKYSNNESKIYFIEIVNANPGEYFHFNKNNFSSLKINGVDYLNSDFYNSSTGVVSLPKNKGRAYLVNIEY